MSAGVEYVGKIMASRAGLEKQRAEHIVGAWSKIDELTLDSGLVPRFDQELRSLGFDPFYQVNSSIFMYGYPVPILMRHIIVGISHKTIVPGIVFEYVNAEPHYHNPVSLILGRVDEDLLKKFEVVMADNPEAVEAMGNNPIDASQKPYWWPIDYPPDVDDDHEFDSIVHLGEPPTVITTEAILNISPTDDSQLIWEQRQDVINRYFNQLRGQLTTTPSDRL